MKILALFTLLLSACTTPSYQGPISNHFDGTRFFNPDRPQTNSFASLLRWQLGFGPAGSLPRQAWPKQVPLSTPGGAKPLPRVAGSQLTVTAVGHATLLLQTQGLNILTDPVWSERASPVSWAGPKRVTPPGINWENLPPIDLVLVSHNHYDHLDLPTLARLVERDNPLILTPLGNDLLIKQQLPQARTVAMDWGDAHTFSPALSIHAEPMQHWSARGLTDRRKALWAAFVLTTPGGNIYFVADSGFGLAPHAGSWFQAAGKKYGGFRLAILPIGAYEPRWFMSYSHMNPAEAVAAKQLAQARYAIGHHFGTFQLTNEAWDAPTIALQQALAAANIPTNTFQALLPSQMWQLPQ